MAHNEITSFGVEKMVSALKNNNSLLTLMLEKNDLSHSKSTKLGEFLRINRCLTHLNIS
jgi:hypothetical protein